MNDISEKYFYGNDFLTMLISTILVLFLLVVLISSILYVAMWIRKDEDDCFMRKRLIRKIEEDDIPRSSYHLSRQ